MTEYYDTDMNGMAQSEVGAERGIGRGKITHRKPNSRKRYRSLRSTYWF